MSTRKCLDILFINFIMTEMHKVMRKESMVHGSSPNPRQKHTIRISIESLENVAKS
jgi:hypothetical protein